MKTLNSAILLLTSFAVPVFANVVVSSPSNGETVGASVHYVAKATTTDCSRGVASMGVYVDSDLVYVVDGTTLDTTLSVNTGKHNTVVEEWDYCGGATFMNLEITSANSPGVHVTSPANGSDVSTPANYVATATTSCSKGVASMGIYANNKLVYVTDGARLNTQLPLGDGAQHTVIEEWDNCGGASYTPVNVTVQGAGKVLSDLQSSGGWTSYGEFAPEYNVCSSNCAGLDWSMSQHHESPSLSGNATKFSIGGSKPYSDVLWTNPVMGQYSTQNLPDTDHKLLPTLHNFTYDAYFYVTNESVTQVLEFDVSMYMDGTGMIWGNQCNNLGGKEWDIWDNVAGKWVSSGVGCELINNGWNHVTIHMQRESDNTLLYQSISLNGVTANINRKFPPFNVPGNWWGVTLNYQMDGNSKQSANTTYLDNFTLTYW